MIYPQTTIDTCFDVLNAGDVDFAVVPFENSTNGQVVFTYDLLRDWFIGSAGHPKPNFKVVGEQFVSIHHYLLSNATDPADIKKIYSHPQVWGQVTKLMKEFVNCTRIDTNSTAEAAQLVTEDNTNTSACISSKMSAQLKNLRILKAEIEDVPENTTRFLVMGLKDIKHDNKETAFEPRHYPSLLTSIMFALNHNDPGGLMSALDSFRYHNINLTSITSRPLRNSQWQYVFFVEAEGSIESERMKASMAKLGQSCTNVVILGSFIRSSRYLPA